jgi:predicted nuclease with TOPRIM domain
MIIVTSALEKRSEPTEQCVARQKLRAKIRYTQQFIVQMEEETGQLVERRTKLEAEVLQCEQEAHKLRESVFVKEQETEMLFGRLRQDTLRTIRENGMVCCILSLLHDGAALTHSRLGYRKD